MVNVDLLSSLVVSILALGLQLPQDDSVSAPEPAQSDAGAAIGLNDCLRSARARNAKCRITREEIERARASLEKAKYEHLPSASVRAVYIPRTSFIDSDSEIGASGERFGSSAYVKQGFLRQWRERALAIDFAKRSVPEAEAMVAEIECSALYEVVATYLSVLAATARAEGAEAAIAALERGEAPLSAAVARGEALELDLRVLRAEISSHRAAAAAARGNASRARDQLARLSGIELSDTVQLLSVDASPPAVDPKTLESLALEGRSDLARIRAQIALKEADPALAGNPLPDATIGVGYEAQGEDHPFESSGFGVVLFMEYPLFRPSLEEAGRDRVRAELRALRAQEAGLIRGIGLDIAVAVSEVDVGGRAREAAQAAAAARGEELRVLLARRLAPTPPSLLDVAIAEARLEDARAALRASNLEHVHAVARLHQAAGLPADESVRVKPNPKPVASSRPRRRALWAWTNAFDGEARAGSRLLDFCVARDIGTVFLSVGVTPNAPSLPFSLEDFLQNAAARGIEVEILVGDPADLDGGRSAIEDAVELLSRLTRLAVPVAGLHLDVEPQAHPKWRSGERERLTDALIQRLRETRSALARRAPGLRVVADIVPTFAERAMVEVNETALMIYSNDVEYVLRDAAPVLDAAATHGKRVWIGVNLCGGEVPSESFQALDAPAFEATIRRIEEHFASHPAFRGVAIHDARTYRDLILQPNLDWAGHGKR